MKKYLLLLSCAIGLSVSGFAQSVPPVQSSAPDQRPGQKQPAPPQKRAAREVKVLEQKLNLTADQVDQVNMLLLNQAIKTDSLKNNPSGNARADRQSLRAAMQETDQQINALLTDDQKKTYAQWKEERKEKRLERMNKTDSTSRF